jgi:hypothetical protein
MHPKSLSKFWGAYRFGTTGDINAKNATIDAKNITLVTSTGNIRANLKGSHSDYATTVNVSTGDSNIDTNLEYATETSRVLEIKTNTGNVNVYFAK